MCGLKAAQIHDRPFRAVKDHVQPLAALDSFLPNYGNILIWFDPVYHSWCQVPSSITSSCVVKLGLHPARKQWQICCEANLAWPQNDEPLCHHWKWKVKSLIPRDLTISDNFYLQIMMGIMTGEMGTGKFWCFNASIPQAIFTRYFCFNSKHQ